jgi:hypothetical protein
LSGIVHAAQVIVVTKLRARLSAALLSVALVASTGVPALAGVVRQACAAKHHDCGQQARLGPCCCGDQADLPNITSGPPTLIDTVVAERPLVLCLFCAVETPAVLAGVGSIDHAPPPADPPDLPILFADLRL